MLEVTPVEAKGFFFMQGEGDFSANLVGNRVIHAVIVSCLCVKSV